MAAWARQFVSQKKKRWVNAEENIDLDLSYITDRIIAMGFPDTQYNYLGSCIVRKNDIYKARAVVAQAVCQLLIHHAAPVMLCSSGVARPNCESGRAYFRGHSGVAYNIP